MRTESSIAKHSSGMSNLSISCGIGKRMSLGSSLNQARLSIGEWL